MQSAEPPQAQEEFRQLELKKVNEQANAAQPGTARLLITGYASRSFVGREGRRPPSAYSDAEWDAVMLHIRVRVPLTAEEHRKILEFLRAGN